MVFTSYSRRAKGKTVSVPPPSLSLFSCFHSQPDLYFSILSSSASSWPWPIKQARQSLASVWNEKAHKDTELEDECRPVTCEIVNSSPFLFCSVEEAVPSQLHHFYMNRKKYSRWHHFLMELNTIMSQLRYRLPLHSIQSVWNIMLTGQGFLLSFPIKVERRSDWIPSFKGRMNLFASLFNP